MYTNLIIYKSLQLLHLYSTHTNTDLMYYTYTDTESIFSGIASQLHSVIVILYNMSHDHRRTRVHNSICFNDATDNKMAKMLKAGDELRKRKSSKKTSERSLDRALGRALHISSSNEDEEITRQFQCKRKSSKKANERSLDRALDVSSSSEDEEVTSQFPLKRKSSKKASERFLGRVLGIASSSEDD